MTNDTTGEGNLTCLLVLTEMAASKLENNDNLMKLLTLAQLDASKLEYENDKLRALVRGLNWCTENPDGPRVDCERCPLGVVDGEPLELMCEKMMRELGIEVDE